MATLEVDNDGRSLFCAPSAYGIAQVDVVEPLAERHAKARLLGARNIWRPQDMPVENRAYAVAFECSSRNEAFTLLQRQVQQQGRICITADGNVEPLMLTSDFHAKELQIIGSSDGWDYHKHAAWYFRYAQEHSMCLEQLFELWIAHDELISTFERLAKGDIHPETPLHRPAIQRLSYDNFLFKV